MDDLHRNTPTEPGEAIHTSDVFFALAASTVVSFGCAMIVYAEPFHFFEYALSDLGTSRTVNGFPNQWSYAFFALGMLSGAMCSAELARRYRHTSPEPNRKAKLLFSELATIGYLIAIVPHDLLHIVHSVGAAFMVGSLWMLTNLYLVDLAHDGHRRFTIACHVVLHVAVLIYAALYAGASPLQKVAQKPAVAALIFVLFAVSRKPRFAEQVRTISTPETSESFAGAPSPRPSREAP
jgi:hypothetical protein